MPYESSLLKVFSMVRNDGELCLNTTRMPTKQRLLLCAAVSFAEKGFTETSMRELAAAIGVKTASLYNHFPSKNAILDHMLAEYSQHSAANFNRRSILDELRENPTAEGIVNCLQTSFDSAVVEYDLKILCVILQEQYRNPVMREYVSQNMILFAENNLLKVINALKELGVIRQDADPDFWMKACSSLFYAFASRYLLGIGDASPHYSGMDMLGMLRALFERMLAENRV